MVDPVTLQRWRHYVLFAGLALVFVLLTLLPFGTGSGGFPGPDLPVALALVWVIRRPDYVPAALIAAVLLMADLLQMRPPGLWAALVVLGTEILRGRQASLRTLPFPAEWATAAAVLVAMTFARWLALSTFMVPHPGLGPLLLQTASTAAAYPVIALLSRHLFGVRKAAPGEVDALGHRL